MTSSATPRKHQSALEPVDDMVDHVRGPASNMTGATAGQAAQLPPSQATIADLMRPPLTTMELTDHAAAAAYLMKHAGTSALVVLNPQAGQPAGIITEADIAHAVADRKNL